MDVPLNILSKVLPMPVFGYLPRKLAHEYKKDKHRKFDTKRLVMQDKQDPVAAGYWDKGFKINSNP